MKNIKVVFGLVLILLLSGCWWDREKSADLNTSEYEETHTEASLSDRLTLVETMIQNPPKDGMNKVRGSFVDLRTTKKVPKSDPLNLSRKSGETWMYSENTDLTLIISDRMNTPIYSFEGKLFPQEKQEQAKLFVEMVQNR